MESKYRGGENVRNIVEYFRDRRDRGIWRVKAVGRGEEDHL